jgi:NADH dehydrogenase
VLLVEGADRVLPTFDPRLSVKAARSLERLKVEVRLGTFVRDVQPHGVTVEHGDAREEIPAGTVLWAAGVQASALAGALGRRLGIAPDRAGRLPVGPDLSPQGARDIIVLGDTAHAEDAGGAPLPGVAPVALQQGSYAADRIRARLAGEPAPGPFRYRDKGSLATIGRAAAVAEIGRLRVSGLVAWLLWLLVHLFTLVGHQNRLLVMIRWAFSYLTHGRGARLITTAWHGDERPRP